MALTRGAGVAVQILSIPFVAVGFIWTIGAAMELLTGHMAGADLASAGGAAFCLLFGIALLRSGKRAARMPEL